VKTLVLNLWVWIVAHPPESLAALSALLYLVLNVVNARVPVEKRQSSVWYKILDALAIATQKGSESRASWPVVGRSIAKDVAAVVVPKPEEPPARDGGAGFASLFVLRGIACAVLALAFWLSACAGAQGPSLSPIPPRVVDRSAEGYGSCLEVGGKVTIPSVGSVVQLSTTCFAAMDAGLPAARDASAPPEPMPEPEPESIPDKSDAGASE
jgi:hypothetical protein